MRAGKYLYAGLSNRTDQAGIDQLAEALKPYGYEVIPVVLKDCLHLKSACCYIGDEAILINRNWVTNFTDYRFIEVADNEPAAANALRVGDTVILPSAFPSTAAKLRQEGFKVQVLDMTELMKAESGVTCSSLIFESEPRL